MITGLVGRSRSGGLIGGHDLGRWWYGAFSPGEQLLIDRTLDRPFSSFYQFASGPRRRYRGTTKILLADVADWFTKDEVRGIGRRFMAKAETCTDDGIPIVDRHFMLTGMVRFYYRCRNDGPDFLPLCEARCRDMIVIAGDVAAELKRQFPNSHLPVHLGYRRLSWLLKKRDAIASARLKAEGEAIGWAVSI